MDSTDCEDVSARKAALRAHFRAYRESLTDEEYRKRSGDVCARVGGLDELERARTVHIYWPIVHQREVDTRPLVRWLDKREKQIVLPMVVKYGHANREGTPDPTRRLAHVRFPGEDALVINKWGIAEPPPECAVPIDELDAVVVPALGADRSGHRLGQGWGYYDEFLSELAVPKIGLVYDRCLVDVLPVDAHDVQLDVVVSESELIRVPSM